MPTHLRATRFILVLRSSLLILILLSYPCRSPAHQCPGIGGLNRVEDSGAVQGCLGDGNELYLADADVGLSVWKIDSSGMRKQGEWLRRNRSPWGDGGPVRIWKHSDGYVLVSETNYPCVNAFDVRDPTHPLRIWSCSDLPDFPSSPWGIDYRDCTLVIGGPHMTLYELSDIHNPGLIPTSKSGSRVGLSSGEVVTTRILPNSGPLVYRLEPGGDLELVASWQDTEFPLKPFVASGEDLVLLANDSYGYYHIPYLVGIVDLSNPDIPAFFNLSTILRWTSVYDLVFDGRIAYASIYYPAGTNNFLEKIDFSNPAHPVLLARQQGGGRLSLAGGRLIVAGRYTVSAWDLNLESHQVLRSFGAPEKILFDGNLGVMAEGYAGISTWDASDPIHLKKIDELRLLDGNWVDDLAIRDGYAYLAAHDAGFVIIDYSQPNSLRQVANIPFDGAADIALDHDLAIVATQNSGYYEFDAMEIFDISEAGDPQYLGSIPGFQGSYFAAIAAEDGFAYLASGNRVLIVDISDPTNPQELAAPEIGSEDEVVPDLDVSDHILVVPRIRNGGILIFDVSNPAQPELLNTAQVGHVDTVYLDDRMLYFTEGSTAGVADLADPTQPVIHTMKTLRASWAITPKDGHVYLASPPNIEIMSLDCSPPTASFDVEISDHLVQLMNTSTSWWDEIHWDFGDGNSAEDLRDPKHYYESPGLYEVTLEISGDNGDSTFAQSITIQDAPKQLKSREERIVR